MAIRPPSTASPSLRPPTPAPPPLLRRSPRPRGPISTPSSSSPRRSSIEIRRNPPLSTPHRSAVVALAAAASGQRRDDSFDLEDELAALDAAVLDDLAAADALADLGQPDPTAKSQRPTPSDPSKRHRKRRSGDKGLSAAILRAIAEEAMMGGGEGSEEPRGFLGEEGDDDAEDGFLPLDDDDGRPPPSSLRPGAEDVLTQDELDSAPPGHRAGYVALVGRPNAGKSTLLNSLLGRKLSIVTPKAQTTRQRVLGIASGDRCQMVLLDTPGLLKGDKSPNALDRRMAAAVSRATADADAVLAIVDASAPGAGDAAREAVSKLVVAAAAASEGVAARERKMKRAAGEDEEEAAAAARALAAARILGRESDDDEDRDSDDDGDDLGKAVPVSSFAPSSSSPPITPVAILLNKVDAAPPSRVDELEAEVEGAVRDARAQLSSSLPADRRHLVDSLSVPVFRTCALSGAGVSAAAEWAASSLPESPPLYPAHLLADAPERFFVAEIVREKIFLLYRDEVPYACAVEVSEYKERGGGAKDYVAVTVFVERPQQRAILLGAGGVALKRLGAAARADAEVFLGRPLYMEISVKVAPKWRSDDRAVRGFGY